MSKPMTQAQEQAANAARKACIAWLKTANAGMQCSIHDAANAAWRKWSQELPYAHEIKSAFLSAWRTQWEAR